MDQSAITPPSVYHLSKQDELSAFMPPSPSGYNHLTTYVRMLQLRESFDSQHSLHGWDINCLVYFRTTPFALHCLQCSRIGQVSTSLSQEEV